MTARQVLIGARDLIAKGWTHSGDFYQDGRFCADGALLEASGAKVTEGEVTVPLSRAHAYYEARSAVCHAIGLGNNLTSWNDRQKSKKPVLEALDRAIEQS